MRFIGILCVFALAGVAIADEGPLEVVAGKTKVTFSRENGAIVGIGETGKNAAVFRGGEFGLWQLRLADGTFVNASAWDGKDKARTFGIERPGDGQVKMTFAGPEADVVVTVKAAGDAVEMTASVTPRGKTVLDVALPGRLRFEPADVTRFVSPLNPHAGVGAAFNGSFFAKQSEEAPSRWEREKAGAKACAALLGKNLASKDFNAPPVALTVTEEGRKWLKADVVKQLAAAQARVSRATPRELAKVVLVDSADGPYVCGADLDGKGLFWRVGGPVGETEAPNVLAVVGGIIDHLASGSPERLKLGLVKLTNGPVQGDLAAVDVQDWLDRLNKTASRTKGAVSVAEIASPAEMIKAVAGDDFLAILNPYGESLPVGASQTLADNVQAIGRYVRGGGNWIEVGGSSFFHAMRPAKYLSYESPYPPIFADFQHLDASAGSISVYRVQPRTWKPWAGATDPSAILIPGKLGCGGDEKGGYADRQFSAFAPAGKTWQTPVTRLVAAHDAADDLRAYALANGITKPLSEKVSPALLGKLKNAVLLRIGGSLEELTAALPLMPTPTLIHVSEFLQGGFDKQYPDHLPPRADFGSSQQFVAFLADVHQRGHLFMPYTNPTWWCDHPRGPTFVREGEAPLTRDLDGKEIYEKYRINDGWTICFWHPAVKAANQKTLEQFTRDFPSDVLFEDQCGARTWRYDINPASPTPYAYAEGSLSMIDQQCASVPLSTEDCYDRVINAETQVCGMTFPLAPWRREQPFARLFKHQYHPRVWEIYPVDQIVAHDKVIFCHHDLGLFVPNHLAVSWTLALGYAMSDRVAPKALAEEKNLQWLLWLDRLQKSVCSRYIGQPLREFKHDRGAEPAAEEDGIIRARYGEVSLVSNLSALERMVDGHYMPAGGFFAWAPGMTAGNLRCVGALDLGNEGVDFVTECVGAQTDLWLLSSGGREVAVELPAAAGKCTITLDGRPPQAATADGKRLRVTLPAGPRKLWHAKVEMR